MQTILRSLVLIVPLSMVCETRLAALIVAQPR